MKKEILCFFDSIYNSTPNPNLKIEANDLSYPFLENGFFRSGTSVLHLFRTGEKWAVVFEVPGYDVQQLLVYSKTYVYTNAPSKYMLERNSYEHKLQTDIIFNDEFKENYLQKVIKGNHKGTPIEKRKLFEEIEGELIIYPTQISEYKDLGILDEYQDEISSADVFLYLFEKDLSLFYQSDFTFQKYFDSELDKIITIDAFNYPEWKVEEDVDPFKLELFQLIADVIANNDLDLWKPKTPKNNHWRDRENGGL